MDKKAIQAKIKNAILQVDAEARIILFGSQARGNPNAASDWDILVLLNKPTVSFKDEQAIRHKLYDVELEIEEPISTFAYSLSDWNGRQSVTPLFKNVEAEGIVL